MTRLQTAGVLAGVVVLAALVVLLRREQQGGIPSVATARHQASVRCGQVTVAYRNHESDVWLTVSGRVVQTLPDTYGRFEHQRFVIQCRSGQTVLIVNDVSIGRRAPVHVGDPVVVRGQYVWNRLGGLIHFTHHGSGGQSGWILVGERVYAFRRASSGQWGCARKTISVPALSIECSRIATASSITEMPRSPIASIPAPRMRGAMKITI